MVRELLNRVRSFFGKQTREQDFDAELASHLEFAVAENQRNGLTPEQARRAALVRLGGLQQAREQHREARGLPSLDTFLQDLRYTLRTLRRNPVFTTIAVLILALGIGANVTVFSVVNRILLRPLPFRDPQRLVWLTANEGKGGLSGTTYTVAAYQDFQRHNRSFAAVTSFQTFYGSIGYKLTGRGEPLRLAGVEVADSFFATLGVSPELGRLFTREECHKGGRPAALLSNAFWRRQFAGDPNIVGRVITINSQAVTVVGVMPQTFDFGSIFSPGLKVDLFVPAVMDFWSTWGNTLALVGRLKPGVTVAQAQAESNILFPQLRAAHPDWYDDYKATVIPLQDYVTGKLRRSLVVLWCAVGLILLIVCVNLSNLLLARAASRSKEFAMRTALGAGRGRIVQQLLTESLILSGAGAVLGLCFAFGAVSYLAHQGSIALPLLSMAQVDGTVLAWTAAMAICVGLFFGILPAFRMAQGDVQETLKDSGQGISRGKSHERLRSTLVVSEIALACVLLVGAGLLLRSFLRVLEVDLGFQPSRAAAIDIDYDDGGKPEVRATILHDIIDRVSAISGIERAGVVDMLPLGRNRSWGFQAKGRIYRPGELQGTMVYVATPGYLGSMGMHILNGRDFTWHDGPKSPGVVIINRATARLHWPGQDPVGRTAIVGGREAQVIGVLSDVRESSLEDVSSPQMYVSASQAGPEGAFLVVRSSLPTDVLQTEVMKVLRSLNPGQPATVFQPIQEVVDHAVSPRRFFVLLVSIFAVLGLILASLGIYGVISYSVSRQTQEIGVRIAVGATQTDVQLRVVWQTLRLAFIGIGVGLVASLGVAKLIGSLLFGTAPQDPATFLAMAILLVVVAISAGYFPARRASRIDPIQALRTT
jgi:predicted permease